MKQNIAVFIIAITTSKLNAYPQQPAAANEIHNSVLCDCCGETEKHILIKCTESE